MDDIVKQAMAKWPNVPHCYDWLGLDSRGNWYMRDASVQVLGRFQSGLPQAKGSLLKHDKLIDFIGRNYAADEQGRWFFQNGPQRVYVELQLTPWVWRLGPSFAVTSHTGCVAAPRACLLDEQGRVYLDTDIGLGLVHSMDVSTAAEAVLQGHWSPQDVESAQLPARYHFVLSPATTP